MYADGAGTCPKAQRASDRLLTLPLHLRLTDDDLRRVTDAIKTFAGGRVSAAA